MGGEQLKGGPSGLCGLAHVPFLVGGRPLVPRSATWGRWVLTLTSSSPSLNGAGMTAAPDAPANPISSYFWAGSCQGALAGGSQGW